MSTPVEHLEPPAPTAELTTGEAADLLGVSATFLDGLLDRGEIPCRLSGAGRRVASRDLLDYKERDDAARLAAHRELIELSEELGLY